jgi:hypothetical protein
MSTKLYGFREQSRIDGVTDDLPLSAWQRII